MQLLVFHPINFTFLYEYNVSQITYLHSNLITEKQFWNTLIQQQTLRWQIHPSQETFYFHVNTNRKPINLPKILRFSLMVHIPEPALGAAFCPMEGAVGILKWSCRLGNNNSVYQAKLSAIHKTLELISQVS